MNTTEQKPRTYFVTMTDKFMSGWGQARGMTNKMIVECETYEQAETIARNARNRREMRRVNIRTSRPYYGNHILPSWKTWEDLGDIWKA
jgi:hypothetical protein